MNREDLDALRRRVEDDYKLDIAAIERLQRRYSDFVPHSSSESQSLRSSSSGWSEREVSSSWSEREPAVEQPSAPMPPAAQPERKNDDLEGSLRSMFGVARK